MLSYFLALLLANGLVSASSAPAWQIKDASGRMRLVGSSFGVAGRNATFDYVIIGAGVGGLTTARRLAEHFSVAVVEAGSYYEIDNGNISQVPSSAFQYETGQSFLTDWNIVTQPEPGYSDRKIHYPRGRCLGGSSALNDQAYQRPTKESMDVWADLVGDDGWTWDSVLPYYKKSANFTPPQLDLFDPEVPISYDADAYSKKGRPLHVSFQHYQQPITGPLVRGIERLGLKETRGQSSGELIGWGFPALTQDPDFATRSSSETSFLQQAIERTSIQVYQHTLAKHILFDSDKRATGVAVSTRGSTDLDYTLSATKEVILSGGALLSPQLLMVSGVGPAAVLQHHGIKVVADRPGVGQNLQEQPWFLSTHKVNVTTFSELSSNATYAAEALEQYLTRQNGPLSNIGADVLAWEKLPKKSRKRLSQSTLDLLDDYPSDWPEIEYLAVAAPISPVPDNGQYMTFSFGIMTPQSRGIVDIDSNDTRTLPKVTFNSLTNRADQEIAIQAFHRMRKWAAATGISLEEVTPGTAVKSDKDVLAYMRQTGYFLLHASCTCAMGRPDNPDSVVDSHATVYGVKGLRIVDASAFPILPPGHPQATVYMMAEKIADDIIHHSKESNVGMAGMPSSQIPLHA